MTDNEIKAYKTKLRRQANPEKYRKIERRYYQKNKTKKYEQVQRWRKANPDRVRSYLANWKAANPEKVAALKRRYYLKRKARIEAALAQYKPSHA
jgi:hypothetical protein